MVFPMQLGTDCEPISGKYFGLRGVNVQFLPSYRTFAMLGGIGTRKIRKSDLPPPTLKELDDFAV